MAYDAGSITAELSIGTAKADADLKKIEDRVKALESGRHVVKISAVFDDSSIGKARASFAALDNAISRDAMQRLRSSPQGSVLGALNALFSPHPVSGAPSPQQAASQGMLGKIAGAQGGGSAVIPAGASGGTVRDVLTGQNAPQKVTVTQQGGGAGGAGAQDLRDAAREEKAAADDLSDAAGKLGGSSETAKDSADRLRDSAGRFASAADRTSEAADDQKAAASDLRDASSGIRGILTSIRGVFGGSGSGGGGSLLGRLGGNGGGSGGSLAGGLAGGIGPGILGISGAGALKAGAIGTALATLPALAGVIGGGMGVALVGGLVAEVAKGNAKVSAEFKGIGTDLTKELAAAGGPVVMALEKSLAGVPKFLASLQPQLAGIFKAVAPQIGPVFAGLEGVVRDVASLARAAAPVFGPVVTGLLRLVQGVLPGITSAVRAFTPFASQFAGILAKLGANLGKFFSDAGPAIKASMTVLSALLGVVGGLLPVIMKLAGAFATTLAPVIAQLAGVVRSLTPFLTVVGQIFTSLAGAILGDLVSAFGALAQLLKGIAPALTSFAQALSGAFAILENSGVFATLGDALENLVPLLSALVTQVLQAMTPLLPPIVTAFSELSQIMVTALANGLQQILPPLTQLAITVLQALATSLPVVLPVLGQVFGFFTRATADAIDDIVKRLSGLAGVIPKPVLDTLAGLAAALLILKKTGVISLGFKLAGIGQKLWSWLTGGTVDIAAGGMQKAADTMEAAAANMQKAADTMAGADVTPGGTPVKRDEQSAEQDIEDTGGGIPVILSKAKTRAGKVVGRVGAAAVTYTTGKAVAQAAGGTPGKVIGGVTDAVSGAIAGSALGPEGTVAGAIAGSLKGIWDAAPAGFGKATAAANAFTASLTALRTASFSQKTGQEQMTASLARGGLTLESSKALTDAYTFAVSENGAKSAAAQGLRQAMIADFERQGFSASQASQLVAQYTTNIETNGESAQAKETARADLIADFEKSGTSASAAAALVDALSRAVSGNGTAMSDAQAARSNLITDLEAVGVNAPQAQQDISNYTDAIQQDGARSQAAQGARQQLLRDLENAGVDSRTAAALVDSLTTAIGNLHSKAVQITMNGQGQYTITGAAIKASQGPGGSGNAAGGLAAGGQVSGGTGPTSDDVPIMASSGEWVIRASSAGKYGPAAMDAVNQGTATIGYAQGGPVGGNLTPSYIGGMYTAFQDQMTTAMVGAMKGSLAAAETASARAAASSAGAAAGAAGTSGGAVEALMKQMAAARGWTGALWNDLYAVEMREAGFSLTATNPSSGAYGLAQFINGAGEYAQYGGNSSTAAGQITGMLNYIAQRYGTPAGAEAHEQQYGWYDQGGWLKPGLTMALNTTGRPERVITGAGMDSLQGLLQMLVSHMASAVGWLRSIAGTGMPGVSSLTGMTGTGDAGGFGLTRADLGLPATTDTSSDSSSASDSSGSSDSSGTTTPAAPAVPAAPQANSVQKLAASAVKKLMGGYIWHNDLGQMGQANTTLNYLMDHTYDARLGQVRFLDGLLAAAQKKKDKKSQAAAEKLLASQGVHIWTIQKAAKGDAARDAARTVTENLMKTYIGENDMTGAGQANALLKHWSVSKYTAVIGQIGHLDSLLAQYRKKKDTRDVAAAETLLRQMGVRKFALGGQISEPVTGFGASGRVYQFGEAGPEYVTPGNGPGGDMTSELRALRGQMERLISTTAAVPRGTGEHVGNALAGAAQSASFYRRYPRSS